jgi:hypothetical protein
MRCDAAALGADGFGACLRNADGEDWLASDGGWGRRARATAEVNAQVAMAMVVPASAGPVRRVGAETCDQQEGRDDRDQTVAATMHAGVDGLRLGGEVVVVCAPLLGVGDVGARSVPDTRGCRAQRTVVSVTARRCTEIMTACGFAGEHAARCIRVLLAPGPGDAPCACTKAQRVGGQTR